MSIFDEKIKQKINLEDEMFNESFQKLASVVTGQKNWASQGNERLQAIRVIEEISQCLNIRIPYSSNPGLSIEWYQEEYFRPQGIMWREVHLGSQWHENAICAMMGAFKDGSPVALIPNENGKYFYRDPATGKRLTITRQNAGLFDTTATLYYRALPMRKINMGDIWRFISESVSWREMIALVCATVCVMLLSMAVPFFTRILFSNVIATADAHLLKVIFLILSLVSVALFLITCVKSMIQSTIGTMISIPLQAAFMMRLLTVPSSQLKTFSAGDLGSRIGSMYTRMKRLTNMFLSMLLTAAISLVCFFQMFQYAVAPALVALITTILLIGLYAYVIRKLIQVNTDMMEFKAEEAGFTYSLIEGMQKVTLAGAEKRMFSLWAKTYRNSIKTMYDPPFLLKVYNVLMPVISLAAMIFMYISAARSKTSPADFYAFISSYSILNGYLIAIGENAAGIASEIPLFKSLRPLMDLAPEITSEKEVVKKVRGNITLRNITFGYSDNMPPVLENLGLQIRQGEYVAIVGATGCGKSTILRLILGFEKPNHGDILIDGKNLNSLDLTSLRRNIGIVLQNGEIIRGTIFSNITISHPELTEEDAWKAAEIAGIADDIRRMPLKMNTPLPDGGRGVSGGQKQRLLIARAIVAKPKILIFDEATSALDNITQKAVSDAIGELACTRIVIAHRLSTIQQCDRILCLDKGKIAEEGTYQQLMDMNGIFTELVKKQQI